MCVSHKKVCEDTESQLNSALTEEGLVLSCVSGVAQVKMTLNY